MFGEDGPTRGAIHIGTSGWHYRHWVGPIYPKEMKPAQFLAFYARQFRTVEINASFYKLPQASTFAKWRDSTPDNFVFACKASRYLTHRKKLTDPKQSSKLFFAAIRHLKRKLGPVLVQLPPRWRVNEERLDTFLEAAPKQFRLAFEFRDESWHTPAIFTILEKHKAALCIHDFGGRQSPIEVTAPFVYVRLHGPEGAYRGRYGAQALKAWARRLRNWAADGRDAFCYFDNDEAGFAFMDAARLLALVGDPRRRTPSERTRIRQRLHQGG
ncbi:MAG TPA: DUF72 domain-containing protein [Aestuariivirgaceae bacterium]